MLAELKATWASKEASHQQRLEQRQKELLALQEHRKKGRLGEKVGRNESSQEDGEMVFWGWVFICFYEACCCCFEMVWRSACNSHGL